jgi:hypothetical protein
MQLCPPRSTTARGLLALLLPPSDRSASAESGGRSDFLAQKSETQDSRTAMLRCCGPPPAAPAHAHKPLWVLSGFWGAFIT